MHPHPFCQAAFRDSLNRIIADIPEVFNDDCPAEENARLLGIQKLRRAIAKRWCILQDLKKSVSEKWFNDLVSQTRETVQTLVQIHGAEIAFAPEPITSEPDEQPPETFQKCDSSTTASGSGSGILLPYEFRYLQNKDSSVWSVLQVQPREQHVFSLLIKNLKRQKNRLEKAYVYIYKYICMYINICI